MPGLLYPAYQKLYSALSHLERFDKESNFFDNVSALDSFFTEYRSITFVMQAALKHTEFFDLYEKNRDQYLTDHWFVEKRNETTKQKPFELIKEMKITLYLPFGGFFISEKKYSVGNDEPLESVFSDIKGLLRQVDPHEVCFSVSFSFHEMEHDIGEQCSLCAQLKGKIQNFHLPDMPLDFLLVNDYTYYPDKDNFDRAERVSMIVELDGEKVANRCPLSQMTQVEYLNYDGTAFGNFTLMHAMLRTIQPGLDIMPAIMVVYDDETYDLDVFDATMKTTMYRKLMETARLVEQQNVIEVCYMSLYSVTPIAQDTPQTSCERIQKSTADILVCASIDKAIHEKEYIFDGKEMESIEYVACVMKNGLKNQLGVSAINFFPIRCAFEKKLNGSLNEMS